MADKNKINLIVCLTFFFFSLVKIFILPFLVKLVVILPHFIEIYNFVILKP